MTQDAVKQAALRLLSIAWWVNAALAATLLVLIVVKREPLAFPAAVLAQSAYVWLSVWVACKIKS